MRNDRAVPSEAQEQTWLFHWAELAKGKFPELALMYHIPNGGSRNRDLKKLLLAQRKAEIAGEEEFLCPVCGGRAVWNRENQGERMRCICHGCGMYLQGTERRSK